jgi:hypothetical protein
MKIKRIKATPINYRLEAPYLNPATIAKLPVEILFI